MACSFDPYLQRESQSLTATILDFHFDYSLSRLFHLWLYANPPYIDPGINVQKKVIVVNLPTPVPSLGSAIDVPTSPPPPSKIPCQSIPSHEADS
jgi:hypothetical protein